jgi:hypothetical protein
MFLYLCVMRTITELYNTTSCTKLLLTVYCTVDIRAKGTEERTREYVLEGMKRVQGAFLHEDLIANVRLETYEGSRYFHVPPPVKK